MDELRQVLDSLIDRLNQPDELRARLADLVSVYPFSEYEYMISHLLAADKLSLDEYHAIRDNYIDRNPFLHLFEISSPRGFGEVWAHEHLKELVPELLKPTRKLDPAYSGQYDLFLEPRIRIEVKASRAVEAGSDEPLYVKALTSDSSRNFDMNFQQIKPSCCDVFIWVAAWRDVIRYWVFPSRSVQTSPLFSPGQHRGNVGEGQLHLNPKNISSFDRYLAEPRDLLRRIQEAFKEQTAVLGTA